MLKIIKFKRHIIHIHDPELIVVGLFLRLIGYQVIFDSHEDLPKQVLSKNYLNSSVARLLQKMILLFEKIFLRFFSAIICATSSIEHSMKSLNKTVITINNYPIILKNSENSERDNNTVVYVGGISKIRGIKELVKSLEFSKKVSELRLIGSFNDKNLYDDVKKMKGWEKVVYYGQLEHVKANLILRKSAVAVVNFLPVPNHLESQPNKLFEYLESKTPILISNFPIWKKFIDNYNCGLTVDPTNPQEIGSALDKLFSSLNLNEMGEIGYKTIIEKYNWENESKKLIKLYNNIL